MPVMDGYEATIAIRKNGYSDLIICGLSANAMQSDIDKAQDAGMNDYITKPIDPDLFELVLSKYLPRQGSSSNPDSNDSNSSTSTNPNNEIKTIPVIWDEESALKLCRGEKQRLDNLIEAFLNQSTLQIAEIEAYQNQSNFDSLAKISHTLKGTAGNVGAIQLMNLASEIEQCALNKSETVSDYIPLLESCYQDTSEALNNYRQTR